MLPVLLLAFIVVPLVELYVIIQVGEAIGVVWTILLLLADSLLGTVLMRSQGRAVWRRFNAALAEGRPPTREVLDGVLVIFGGALLLTPGFVTDALGVALLAPPSRALARRFLVRRVASRMWSGVLRHRGGGPRRGAGGRRDFDVEGRAVESDRPRLP